MKNLEPILKGKLKTSLRFSAKGLLAFLLGLLVSSFVHPAGNTKSPNESASATPTTTPSLLSFR